MNQESPAKTRRRPPSTADSTPAPIQMIDLVAQHRTLASQTEQAVLRVLAEGQFILGRDLARFEASFAEYCGARHAVGVSSGTAALALALRAHGIGPGDQVLVPAHTFIASLLAVRYVGATPVLVDVDEVSYTLDIEQTAAAITNRTRAVMPVHLYGQMVDMKPLLALARRHDLVVVEDAAQAHGAEYHGRRAGSLGHCAGFSFFPSKNLGAAGDAGLVTTRRADIAERLRRLRNYGRTSHNDFTALGFNERLDNIQAAVLQIKLPHLDAWNDRRRQNAALYHDLLADQPVTLPTELPARRHVYHQYVIRTDRRDALMDHLAREGIASGVHYPKPPHKQRVFEDLPATRGRYPVTERLAREVLSLPVHEHLQSHEVRRVAREIGRFFKKVS